MLTDTDFKRIQKLVGNLATKEDIKEMREEIADLRETVQALLVSVDRFVKVAADLQQENVAINAQLTRHEEWIREIARKARIALKF